VPTHEPCDPLAADGVALSAQFGVNARRTVAFPVLRMDPPDLGQQLAVGDLARALRPQSPSIEARRRHIQRIAHNPHRPDILVILDQAEPHLSAFEKVATAFLKCRAPSAGDRSRGEDGRFRMPRLGRNAGPAPGSGAAPTRIPPFAPIAPVAQHRGRVPSSLAICNNGGPLLASSATASRLNSISELTPSLARSTPFRSCRSLAKVSTNSGESHSFAQPFLCVSGMISCPTASCQGDRCPSFSGLPAIARPITPLRQLGNGSPLIIVRLYASACPHRG
jgi:hypothetical protein